MLSLLRARVQSVVGELRACNMAKKKKNYKIRAAVIFIICVLFISDAGGHVLDLGSLRGRSFLNFSN